MAIKYLNKSLRSHYLLAIVLSMVLPVLLVAGCLYYIIFKILADEMVLPDVIARDLLPVIERINFLLLVGLPIVFVVILTWAVILVHKVIAPLERLEEDLVRIDGGDYSARLQVQHDHDLKPVADVINDLVEKLEKHEKEKKA